MEIHHEWRCIFNWTRGFSSVMMSCWSSGVYPTKKNIVKGWNLSNIIWATKKGPLVAEDGSSPFKGQTILGGGFKHFFFSPLFIFGEMIQFDWYFSKGLKPPTRIWFSFLRSEFSWVKWVSRLEKSLRCPWYLVNGFQPLCKLVDFVL